MNKTDIQQQIVSRFWSERLKKHIAETGHVFSDEELLGLVWHFVPEYQERLRLFGLIAEHIPTVSEHARLCMDFMETSLARFQQCGAGEVYELRITDQDDPEERYLCDSFDTALQMIDGFWEEYDFSHETPTTEYTIVKRSILRADDSFREDELGRCELGPGKVLLSAEVHELGCEYDPRPESCVNCEKACVSGADTMFPPFLPNLSLVKYRNLGKIEYGITFEPRRNNLADSVFIMPLGGRTDPDWWDHDHVYHPYVDIASEEELTAKQKEEAATLRAFLEDYMKQHPDE